MLVGIWGSTQETLNVLHAKNKGADQTAHLTTLISFFVLAHRIRISEILPWDRKSCLTYESYLDYVTM